jgi:hypothetical protein
MLEMVLEEMTVELGVSVTIAEVESTGVETGSRTDEDWISLVVTATVEISKVVGRSVSDCEATACVLLVVFVHGEACRLGR